jgi:hypothetical protein
MVNNPSIFARGVNMAFRGRTALPPSGDQICKKSLGFELELTDTVHALHSTAIDPTP